MKLMRFETADGSILPCVLDTDGIARDLSSLTTDISPAILELGLLEQIASRPLQDFPFAQKDGLRVASPISQPRNILCIGLNYLDHAREAGMEPPTEPIVFNKVASTFCGPNDDILYSPKMTKLDWEVELGIVIGKPALNITRDDALDHIAGFVLVNDVSERAWQIERGGQWSKGKSFPNFCPTGPVLVTPDSVGDVNNLDMWLDVNGMRMQTGNTSTMIFDAETIVSYLSEFMLLQPGDLICTGTPPGVGMGMTPPRYLKTGDVVTLGIEGLGRQRQVVTEFSNL
ncbi:MAG: fumarylacetoacetate hydrolase family protein [Pelagimonas sp.]|nr:fumarylacetoacetate hydrolase family protein [Pelagimonas sp.]